MLRIVSAVEPETAVSLLQPEICRRVSVFLNLTDSDEVFDYLWNNKNDVDLVVIEGSNLDQRELHAASRERPKSMFIIVAKDYLDLNISTLNIVLTTNTAELRQAAVAIFRY